MIFLCLFYIVSGRFHLRTLHCTACTALGTFRGVSIVEIWFQRRLWMNTTMKTMPRYLSKLQASLRFFLWSPLIVFVVYSYNYNIAEVKRYIKKHRSLHYCSVFFFFPESLSYSKEAATLHEHIFTIIMTAKGTIALNRLASFFICL